ncbi:MAG: nickel pincer cofactor biosynthesis protein LarC [Sedimentisphaerales bacterium]|nr:nickel pincer cofactor biosynthesis protein LarC [Sedimentisphaerales bacterium]
MKIAYFDCFSGAAGDMIVGACLDAGASADYLRGELAKLGLAEVEIRIDKVVKQGISATQFEPICGATAHSHHHNHKTEPEHHQHNHGHDHNQDHSHHHDHNHGDEHAHSHDHKREHSHGAESHHHQPHRNLKTICDMIEAADLSERVKEQSQAIFRRLAQAEAKVHATTEDAIHFHEVGAADAIMDIVGACVALESLGIDKVYVSGLVVGSGTVQCAHGVLPVPAPATAELIRGLEVSSGPAEGELLTPTGAAILTTLSEGFGAMPSMRIEKSGYGAGQRENQGVPNVLRLTVGEQAEVDASADEVCVLEANIDDATGELLGHVNETLLSNGALDVFTTAVMMKKNRPGVQLTVLARPADREALTETLLAESTTFGVRWHMCKRRVLQRQYQEVATRFGTIRIKCGSMNGSIVTAAPEFEDCRRAAAEHGVTVKLVLDEARKAYNQG